MWGDRIISHYSVPFYSHFIVSLSLQKSHVRDELVGKCEMGSRNKDEQRLSEDRQEFTNASQPAYTSHGTVGKNNGFH